MIGVAPAYTAPVSGAVPLYEFVSNNGVTRILGKQYYSSFPGYTFAGIFGYIFPTHQPNTVPLYAFSYPSSRYYGLSSVEPNDYTEQGVLGYVYATQVAKTRPIYQHRTSNNLYRFSNEPG